MSEERDELVPIVVEIGGYVTTGRAAELLGVNEPRVHQLVAEKRLQAIGLAGRLQNLRKRGAIMLISKDSIENYRRERQQSGKGKPGPRPLRERDTEQVQPPQQDDGQEG